MHPSSQAYEPKPRIVPILEDRQLGGVSRMIEAMTAGSDGENYEHHICKPTEASAALRQGTTMAVIHEPSQWMAIPRFAWWRRLAPTVLVEHHYSAGFERHNVGHRTRFRNLLRLQAELIKVQDWVQHTGAKL